VTAEVSARTNLPVPDRRHAGEVMYEVRNPSDVFPQPDVLRPPKDAPNIVVVLLDDVGFGASSAFGGPCSTPVAERLADGGLKLSRFHTTAICSPTRQALLTGRNHHTAEMGNITEFATSVPGYSSIRPNTCATVAEILRLNGYSTAQFGKCHEVPTWEATEVGPFDRWPTGSGFETFYGFLGGETNQYAPTLFNGTTPVEPDRSPEEGYHLTEDLADRAIGWIRQQKTLTRDRPLFLYFAPGATHTPHHVPEEWSAKYRGRFDGGWDALREETFRRQKQLGVIPEDAELTARSAGLPAWADMPLEMRPLLARQMEVYAGFLEHTDFHVGRVIDALSEVGVLDDTLVYYILGDNGASGEGGPNGCFSESLMSSGPDIETPEFLMDRIDTLGTPESLANYSACWAHALNTPYQWTKQVASHWGGTRNGAIVHWPRGVRSRGQIRSQFTHVIDVVPTMLAAAGLPEPTTVNGVAQTPIEGVTMAYFFDRPEAPERHRTQYFEVMGNRGIYHDGWTAVAKHFSPWEPTDDTARLDDDVWELYGPDDWTQARDIAGEQPQKLRELQRLFLIEAARHGVLPLQTMRLELANPDISGRRQLIAGKSQLLYGSMRRVSGAAILNTKNKSHAIVAEILVPEGGGSGVIVCQGGRFGGWSLYLDGNGALTYSYNLGGAVITDVTSTSRLAAGIRQVHMAFAYDGGGLGAGAEITLRVDGTDVGQGRLERTTPIWFSTEGSEEAYLGRDGGSLVTGNYTTPKGAYTGVVNWVRIELGGDSQDHLIRPEQRWSAAMARE
jgi:arylsulfatase A-like enzyme